MASGNSSRKPASRNRLCQCSSSGGAGLAAAFATRATWIIYLKYGLQAIVSQAAMPTSASSGLERRMDDGTVLDIDAAGQRAMAAPVRPAREALNVGQDRRTDRLRGRLRHRAGHVGDAEMGHA